MNKIDLYDKCNEQITSHIFKKDIYCPQCATIYSTAFVDFNNKTIQFFPLVLKKKICGSLEEYNINLTKVSYIKKFDIQIKCPLCENTSKIVNIPKDWKFSDESEQIIRAIYSLLGEDFVDKNELFW